MIRFRESRSTPYVRLLFHSIRLDLSVHPPGKQIRSRANNITRWRNNTFHLCREIWISSFSIPRRVKQTSIYVEHKYFISSLHYYFLLLFQQQSFSFLFFFFNSTTFLLLFPRTISLFLSTIIKHHGSKLCQKKKKNFFIQRSTSSYVSLGIS